MALIEIITYPDKILQEKTSSVTEFDSSLQKLIDNMIETMYAAPGIGLAANQVGVSKQVAVIDVSGQDEPSDLLILINPEIIDYSDEIEIEEGCLSLPGYTTIVKRAEKVKVRGLDRNGSEIRIKETNCYQEPFSMR